MKNCTYYYKLISALLLSLLLAACSSSGGSNGTAQTIAFQTTGTVSASFSDGTYTNTATGGSGTGAITYKSSNTGVATVDESSGVVTFVTAGSVVITATKAADDTYAAATAQYTINISAGTAIITFLDGSTSIGNGTVTKYSVEPSIVITATAAGPGNVFTYATSDSSIADVDVNTGAITIHSSGTVTITATITANAQYTGGTGSYQLVATNQVPFTAWIGETDTEVHFPATAANAGLYFNRATTATSSPAASDALTVDSSDSTMSAMVTDTVATLSQDAYYWLSNLSISSPPTAVSLLRFPARARHQVFTYNDKLWIVGGYTGSGVNDVWSSTNGETWVEESSSAGFTARYDHQIVSFANQLWLYGGNGSVGSTYYYTQNPVDWTPNYSAQNMGAREGHQVVEFNGKLWVFGGSINGVKQDSVMSSTDGVTWTTVTTTNAPSARAYHQMVVFNNALWVIGGLDASNTPLNDVWSSTDGITWTQQTPGANHFAARHYHSVTVFNDQLWLIGGRTVGGSATYYDDIWTSVNGTDWTQVVPHAQFGKRHGHSTTVFSGKLWLTGGFSTNTRTDEVWSTADGVNWVKENALADFSGRQQFQAEVFNSKLWLFGGDGEAASNSRLQDAWSSSDGINWTQESDSPGYGVRSGHQVVAHDDGQLWLTGGFDGTFYKGDIWSSSNGTTWTKASSSDSAFSARSEHQMVSFAGSLFVIGGTNGSTAYNDVWQSNSGSGNWSSVTTLPSGYFGHQVTSFNNKLYLLGGADGSGNLTNDVLTSDTGSSGWTQVPDPGASFIFTPRKYHQAIEFGGYLYVIGGTTASGDVNDIWRMDTAGNWTAPVSSAPFSARHSFQLEVYDNKMWLIGGIDASNNKLNDVWSTSDGIHWRRGFQNSVYFKAN